VIHVPRAEVVQTGFGVQLFSGIVATRLSVEAALADKEICGFLNF